MASADSEIIHEFRFFRVYKDDRVQLFKPPVEKIPPFDDPATGVRSKDVTISSDPPVSARLFLPKTAAAPGCSKLPLLFYLHGGGFCMQSAFSRQHHGFVAAVVAAADCVAVSVEYGLFPDRPLPACYEDSWAALQWVAAKQDPWIAEHVDLDRVFIAGNSAGGNISHTLACRVGSIRLSGVKVVGVILVHPYFGGTGDDRMWLYMCPTNAGLEDPRLKPSTADLARLGCERVLVFVAEKDHLMEVGIRYVEELKKSGWGGNVELVKNVGEPHSFHMSDPNYEKAVELKNKFASFIRP
ncbi:probable carboxylesterase 12 [Punica granatum]|uniref:Alpha/beta hydrolase fold-3 domain-containing protein n=2 Tax=Punica granatum TaxID=22663 RepID=A0A218X3I1_PUNGR|nr:probable carboxylesterase 12 [Punica granatum]OWM79240.1 hypothetical protein CDL15_Pgr003412 [Punica granatum]PKI39264.1 hypothetical protein CRG98_040320 [Punica granatum]